VQPETLGALLLYFLGRREGPGRDREALCGPRSGQLHRADDAAL